MAEKNRVSGSIDIAAPPEKVYAMVTDLPRMAEWSPENQGGSWQGGASVAAPGVRFKGRNRNGPKKWTGAVVVNEATAPSRFEFTTVAGPIKFATWRYDIEPTPGGCRVTETWIDTRPGLFCLPAFGKAVTNVADRAAWTQQSIDTTLANIKKAAEQ